MTFFLKQKKIWQMDFLDVYVICENGKFVTNIYKKETFTGV